MTIRLRAWQLIAVQLVAFWPVLLWYVRRMTDSSDEPWGLLALITALVFILIRGTKQEVGRFAFLSSMFFLVLYVLSYTALPPLGRAVLAVLSIACTLSPSCLGRSVHIGIIGLLLLSLPIIASLQFYLGYPVRFFTAIIAAKIITRIGFDVTASGICLEWAGEIIAIDAPCAGIRMLWSGLYLNFTLACLTGLGALKTWLTYSLSMGAIFIGNVFRATALFFTETGIINGPEWAHQAIGMATFGVICVSIIMLHQTMKGKGEQRQWA